MAQQIGRPRVDGNPIAPRDGSQGGGQARFAQSFAYFLKTALRNVIGRRNDFYFLQIFASWKTISLAPKSLWSLCVQAQLERR